MLKTFTNLTKAVIAVASSPAALAVDIFSLPKTAYNNEPPFQNTQKMFKAAGESFEEAIKAEKF